mgnify:CR=1 FL=1
MIKQGEIQFKAREIGVRDQQIEKDYILSWILQGIAQHKQLSSALIFKGGTALKKVYFEDYRFSEDLDFTLLDDDILNQQIYEWFFEVFEYIKEEANIPLEIIDNKKHEEVGINFYISYVGPLGGLGANKSVKVDISRGEPLLFEPLIKGSFLSYSDQKEHQLVSYCLEEILVEKLRSVLQRMQARDFYDIWYLLEIQEMDVAFYTLEFQAKCEIKEIDPKGLHFKLEQRIPQYKGRWKSSLADQIQDLPDFEQVVREVLRHLKKLEL